MFPPHAGVSVYGMHNDQRTETPPAVDERVDEIAWAGVSAELDRSGWAMLGGVLSSEECGALAASYDEEALFRSRVVMARHGFGQGEYKYFAYPEPGAFGTPAYARHRLSRRPVTIRG